MKFPVIVFEKNNKMMYSLDIPYLMCDIRVINLAMRDVELIDSNGDLYTIKRIEKGGGINFIESLKRFGIFVKVNPIFDGEKKYLSLEDLKKRVKINLKKQAKFWAPLYAGRSLNKVVDECQSYSQLIMTFV